MSGHEREEVVGHGADPQREAGVNGEKAPGALEEVAGAGQVLWVPGSGVEGKRRPVQVVVTGRSRAAPGHQLPPEDQPRNARAEAHRPPGDDDLHGGDPTGGGGVADEADDVDSGLDVHLGNDPQWSDDHSDHLADDDVVIHEPGDESRSRSRSESGDEGEGEDGNDIMADFRPPKMAGPRRQPRRGRRTVKAKDVAARRVLFTAEQRLMILDTWMRSKLPAKDFAGLVGVSPHSLYKWKKRFEAEGPAGLRDRPRGGPKGSRLPEPTKRAILMLKEAHPEWGCERIHDVLMRSEGCKASPGAISRVLKENGYVTEHVPTRPHPDKVRRFERAKPNQLWQTDLFTFVLKRQNRRVHLVGFMDDHSRFVVGFGLHATANGAMVREVFESAIANHGAPEEVLTDNGSQYITWRGKSAFTKLLERRGIRHVVARPKRPQTLGKVERFWGTLWRECVESAIFRDLDEARQRIALFIDHYNFQRPHRGLDGLVPADRFYDAAPEVKEAMRKRVADNAAELAKNGAPRRNVYLTGKVGDLGISLHSKGDRLVVTRADGSREEVQLMPTGDESDGAASATDDLPEALTVAGALAPARGTEADDREWSPGTSPLDDDLQTLVDELWPAGGSDEGDDESEEGGDA
jgi:transposase InsO family protein